MTHERRPLLEKKGLEARNQQAARDALRRRQKAKKARTVKRHVRYKEKKRLLGEMEASEPVKPIVARELGIPGNEGAEEEVQIVNMKKNNEGNGKQSAGQIDNDGEGTGLGSEEKEEKVDAKDAKVKITETIQDSEHTNGKQADGKTKKKYMPFTKQIKQAEKAQREREERERERKHKIEIREKMLKLSRKQRKERVSLVYTLLQAASRLWNNSTNKMCIMVSIMIYAEIPFRATPQGMQN